MKIIGLILLNFSLFISAQALSISSDKNGDWSNPATWVGGVVPSATDDVIIMHNVDVDVNTTINSVSVDNSTSASNFRIKGGVKLTVTTNIIIDYNASRAATVIILTTGELLVMGDVTFNQTHNSNGLIKFDLNGNSTATVDGDFIFNHSAGGGNSNSEIILSGTSDTESPKLNIGSDLILNADGGKTLALKMSAKSELTVDGDLLMNKNGAIGLKLNMDSKSNLLVQGNLIATHNSGADELLIDISGQAEDDPRIEVIGDVRLINTAADLATKLLINRKGQLIVGGDLELSALSEGDIIIDLNGSSKLILKNGISRTSGFGLLSMADNLNCRVIYQGTSGTQTIAKSDGSGTDAFIYRTLEINNTSGVNLELEGEVEVDKYLYLTSGIVNTSASDHIVLTTTGSTCDVGSTASHINGPIRKRDGISGGLTFPTGKGGVYAPIAIVNNPGNSGDFTAEYFMSDPGNQTSKDGTLEYISDCEYWQLDRAFGNDVGVQLFWDNTRSCVNQAVSTYKVARYDGSQWKDHDQKNLSGDLTAGSIESNGSITSFSPFTLASSTVLPIELISFKTTYKNNAVYIDWTTASEINVDRFEVQRSSDQVNFKTIDHIMPSNSSQHKTYQVIDGDIHRGLYCYRLVSYDYDGKYEIFNVECQHIDANSDWKLKSNILSPSQSLILNADQIRDSSADVFIYSSDGGMMVKTSIQGGHLELPTHNLNSGVYFIRVIQDGRLTLSEKFVIL